MPAVLEQPAIYPAGLSILFAGNSVPAKFFKFIRRVNEPLSVSSQANAPNIKGLITFSWAGYSVLRPVTRLPKQLHSYVQVVQVTWDGPALGTTVLFIVLHPHVV